MIIRTWKDWRAMRIGRPFRKTIVPAALLSAFLALALPQRAAAEQDFNLKVYPGFFYPIDNPHYTMGFTGSAGLDWRFLPFMGLNVEGGYLNAPVVGGSSVSTMNFEAGPLFFYRPLSRLSMDLSLGLGMYSAAWAEASISGINFGGRFSVNYHISPVLALGAYGQYRQYSYTPKPFINSVSAGISLTVNLNEAFSRAANIGEQVTDQRQVFPVSYAWYNDHPFATVKITNNENVDITRVNVSFYLQRYMSQPKVCGVTARLRPGESVEVPVTAFFNESVMDLTENVTANAQIIVDYRKLGSDRSAVFPFELPIFHRNAMSWDDDRRASSFVSARDPGAVYFSRSVTNMVQDRQRPQISRNIQVGLGMFETLNAYGINYVVDPASSYVTMSENASSLDSLNYPYQTLMYRGGDCDDMSILYCSLMEAAGIETAFITIPGHIYLAFDSGMTEDEACGSFYAPGELIFYEGRAWVPVEITIPREGFYRAWRVGAKEWRDAGDEARIYPMHDSWKIYPPVNVPGAVSRFVMPSEEKIAQAFDQGMNDWINFEIYPRAMAMQKQLEKKEDPVLRNRLGVLYGSFGVLDKARQEFAYAARDNNVDGWINLGSVAFLDQRYTDALWYYNRALEDDPNNPAAMLGLARCYYEENRFADSDEWYARLVEADPDLARRYAYLGSFFETTGRAYSLADRLNTTTWAENNTAVAKARPRDKPLVAGGLAAEAAKPAAPSPAPADSAPAPAPVQPAVKPEKVPGTAEDELIVGGGLAGALTFGDVKAAREPLKVEAPNLAKVIESGAPIAPKKAVRDTPTPDQIIAGAKPGAETRPGKAGVGGINEPLRLVLPRLPGEEAPPAEDLPVAEGTGIAVTAKPKPPRGGEEKSEPEPADAIAAAMPNLDDLLNAAPEAEKPAPAAVEAKPAPVAPAAVPEPAAPVSAESVPAAVEAEPVPVAVVAEAQPEVRPSPEVKPELAGQAPAAVPEPAAPVPEKAADTEKPVPAPAVPAAAEAEPTPVAPAAEVKPEPAPVAAVAETQSAAAPLPETIAPSAVEAEPVPVAPAAVPEPVAPVSAESAPEKAADTEKPVPAPAAPAAAMPNLDDLLNAVPAEAEAKSEPAGQTPAVAAVPEPAAIAETQPETAPAAPAVAEAEPAPVVAVAEAQPEVRPSPEAKTEPAGQAPVAEAVPEPAPAAPAAAEAEPAPVAPAAEVKPEPAPVAAVAETQSAAAPVSAESVPVAAVAETQPAATPLPETPAPAAAEAEPAPVAPAAVPEPAVPVSAESAPAAVEAEPAPVAPVAVPEPVAPESAETAPEKAADTEKPVPAPAAPAAAEAEPAPTDAIAAAMPNLDDLLNAVPGAEPEPAPTAVEAEPSPVVPVAAEAEMQPEVVPSPEVKPEPAGQTPAAEAKPEPAASLPAESAADTAEPAPEKAAEAEPAPEKAPAVAEQTAPAAAAPSETEKTGARWPIFAGIGAALAAAAAIVLKKKKKA